MPLWQRLSKGRGERQGQSSKPKPRRQKLESKGVSSDHNVGQINQRRNLTWYDTNGGTGDPSALVEVPLDAEDGNAIEESEEEEEARIDVEEKEGLLRDVALGITIGHLGGRRS